MKRLFSIICFLSLFAGATMVQGQPAAWDSTYRPATYPLLTEQFKTFKHSSSDIVFLGNSITFGIDWYELLQLPQARNRGISGDMTFGVLERLQEVIDGKPAKLFILIGVNDILRNVPDSYIINNYNKIVSRVQKGSPKTQIYIQSILPVNEAFPQHKSVIGKKDRILAVNQALKKIAEDHNVTYIDLHSAMKDPSGMLKSELTYDGLHLKIEGYQVWKKVLEEGGYLKNSKK